ncbi:hypothetical protein VPH35_020176 [Triticum aestivum]|uniref:At1g61320/AtMIF1 LRR domain-containing protein n=2 Tax=Triticum TaxID=4564 RepID=A0A9R1NPH2_TRITD|nr:unnamed protein product [Triticum turgidum subsp. durum]
MHNKAPHPILYRTPNSPANRSAAMEKQKLRRLVRGPRRAAGELTALIVGRLDTRTALSTAVLARRWARVPRDLPALDFRVSDILPPEYDQAVALREDNLPPDPAMAGMLDGFLARCEMGSTRALADGVTSFLAADCDGDARRRVKTLRLEFFPTDHGGIIEHLIAAAVGSWGVEDLEMVVRPASGHHDGPAYPFPDDCLGDGGRSRLRSLALGNTTLPPLHSYEALTTLVLQGVAASTPVAVYERLFSDLTRLQVLHLISCSCTADLDHLVVDAPGSAMRELVVEECAFSRITVRALPMLARLACIGTTVVLRLDSVPNLTQVNLTFWGSKKPSNFLGKAPAGTTSLVLRFTRPSRWVVPMHLATPFLGLKRLLVADLPSNWDVSWPRMLVLAARSLEVLHSHVAHSDEKQGEEIAWWLWPRPKRKLRHRNMKEVVMIGFTQTSRQIKFLRDLVRMCRSLQRVVLLRDGQVQYNGLWDWKMVGQPECPWSTHDKMAVTKMIEPASRPLVDVILG